MNYNLIFFAIIPFILMAIISVGMPFYKLKIMKGAGEKILPLVKDRKIISFVTYITAYIILILSIMVDFGKLNFVIPYCAVLGLYVSTKEGTFRPVNGVYENLLIVGSDIIRYDDIISFPIEELPPEERAKHPANVLLVVTKKGGKRNLTFNNANELSEVLSILRNKV